jgi:integrase
MKLLSALINFASDRYGTDDEPLIKVNPVTRLTRNRAWHEIPPRRGTIPDHKLPEFYRAVVTLENVNARDLFLILLLTGLSIDFEQGLLVIPAHYSKNHREHRLPLSDFLLTLLQQRRRRDSGSEYVFPGRGNRGKLSDLRRALAHVRERSGVKFLIHDLRRTFLSMAEKLDLPHYVLKRLINHSNSFDVTDRYIVISPDRLRGFMNQITNQFLLECEANPNEYLLWQKPQPCQTAGAQQLQLKLVADRG